MIVTQQEQQPPPFRTKIRASEIWALPSPAAQLHHQSVLLSIHFPQMQEGVTETSSTFVIVKNGFSNSCQLFSYSKMLNFLKGATSIHYFSLGPVVENKPYSFNILSYTVINYYFKLDSIMQNAKGSSLVGSADHLNILNTISLYFCLII